MLSPTSQVLVCLLRSPRDLEIARLLGWYRLPFKSSPKVVAVDYLALYQPERDPGDAKSPGQPSSLGDQGAQIQYVAEVKGHGLTARLELLLAEPDHLRAQDDHRRILAERKDGQRFGGTQRGALVALVVAVQADGQPRTISGRPSRTR